MFLELIGFLTHLDSGFGVIHYLSVRAVFALLFSLVASLLFGHFFIRKLKKYQIRQVIREEGVASHFSKSGTPTMGGIMILGTFIGSLLVWGDLRNPYFWIVVLTAIFFGAIGFLDDYLKIKHKSSDGLSSKLKMLFQSIASLLIITGLVFFTDNPLQFQLLIPFLKI
jgi:phospho-N-acetylmuramoyl-pentapeptide-transferase